MPTATFTQSALIAGFNLSLAAPITKGADGVWQPTLPVGNSLTGWTNTGTYTATLPAGTNLTSGMTVDLYWSAGYRYGCSVSVAGSTATFTAGSGTAYPATGTSVIAAQQFPMTLAISGNAIGGIMATATSPSLFIFYDAQAVAYPYYLDPGTVSGTPQSLNWSSLTASTSPWVNKILTSATVSSSNTTTPTSPAVNTPVTVGLVYDNTTGSGS